MSMSTHVVGIKPPDEKWQKMKAVWDACREAGVEVPDDVNCFFECETPDDKGVLVDLADNYSPVATKWSNISSGGYEIKLEDLPADIKIIRFYNSW